MICFVFVPIGKGNLLKKACDFTVIFSFSGRPLTTRSVPPCSLYSRCNLTCLTGCHCHDLWFTCFARMLWIQVRLESRDPTFCLQNCQAILRARHGRQLMIGCRACRQRHEREGVKTPTGGAGCGQLCWWLPTWCCHQEPLPCGVLKVFRVLEPLQQVRSNPRCLKECQHRNPMPPGCGPNSFAWFCDGPPHGSNRRLNLSWPTLAIDRICCIEETKGKMFKSDADLIRFDSETSQPKPTGWATETAKQPRRKPQRHPFPRTLFSFY